MKDDTLLLIGNEILGSYQELEEILRKEELIFYTAMKAKTSISFSELEFTISSRSELIILGGIYNHNLIDGFLDLIKYQSPCVYRLRNVYPLAIGYPTIIREEEINPLILICERDRIEFHHYESSYWCISEFNTYRST